MIGHVIEGYKIEKELGNGVIGKSYLGASASQKVVIKVAEEMAYLPNIEELRQIIEDLAPAYIASYIKIRMDENRIPFVLIQHIPGKSLFEHLSSEGRLPEEEAFVIFQKILHILSPLHENNLSHGSLRPENIILTPQSEIYLTDFGLAEVTREINQEAYLMYVYGKVIGRKVIQPFRYFSPSRMNKQASTPKDDIFSLGVILYQMLTGEVPTDNAPSQFCGKLEMAVEKIVMKMVGDISVRYPHAKALLQEIERIKDSFSFSINPSSPGYSLPGLLPHRPGEGRATTKLHLAPPLTKFNETTKLNINPDFLLPDIEEVPEIIEDAEEFVMEDGNFSNLENEISSLEEKHKASKIPLLEPSSLPFKNPNSSFQKIDFQKGKKNPSVPEKPIVSPAASEIFQGGEIIEDLAPLEEEVTLGNNGEYESDILTSDLLEDSDILEAAKEFDSQFMEDGEDLSSSMMEAVQPNQYQGSLSMDKDLLESMAHMDLLSSNISDPGLDMGITEDIVLEEFKLPEDSDEEFNYSTGISLDGMSMDPSVPQLEGLSSMPFSAPSSSKKTPAPMEEPLVMPMDGDFDLKAPLAMPMDGDFGGGDFNLQPVSPMEDLLIPHDLPTSLEDSLSSKPSSKKEDDADALSPEEAMAMLEMMSPKKKTNKTPEKAPAGNPSASGNAVPVAKNKPPTAKSTPPPKAPAESPSWGEGSGNCSVLVTGLKNSKKKDSASEVIAKIRGISVEKALEMTNSPFVKVLQDVPEEKAQECLNLLKEANIPAKITKKKGS